MDLTPKLARLLNEVGFEKRRSAAMAALPALGLLITGTFIGGIFGLLFAPNSGKQLRENMLNRLRARFSIKTRNRHSAEADATTPIAHT
jgi:hypothetical protein